MNILLICNKKNLLGNKLVIDSTLYCNNGVTFYIWLTEDIGEEEKKNIKNLVEYLDGESRVFFEYVEGFFEKYFYFIDDLLYLSADTLVTQTIEHLYEAWAEDARKTIIVNEITEEFTEQRYPIIFFNLAKVRKTSTNLIIDTNDSEITILDCDGIELDYFEDSRIGFKGKFSFNFNMPIIFWFTNENKKIYEIDLPTWFSLYPDFEPMVRQIFLSETIKF